MELRNFIRVILFVIPMIVPAPSSAQSTRRVKLSDVQSFKFNSRPAVNAFCTNLKTKTKSLVQCSDKKNDANKLTFQFCGNGFVGYGESTDDGKITLTSPPTPNMGPLYEMKNKLNEVLATSSPAYSYSVQTPYINELVSLCAQYFPQQSERIKEDFEREALQSQAPAAATTSSIPSREECEATPNSLNCIRYFIPPPQDSVGGDIQAKPGTIEQKTNQPAAR